MVMMMSSLVWHTKKCCSDEVTLTDGMHGLLERMRREWSVGKNGPE